MYLDPRGGHNRKKINQNFFKSWSPQMSYILGLIYADGAVEDARKSSRTCYLALTSNDKVLLEDVRRAMSSNHNIYYRAPRLCTFRDGNRTYLSSESWILRIGSKLIYNDLLSFGLTPRKSLTIKFPEVPCEYLNFFIRGYFDGDGSISVYLERGSVLPRITTVFTSGSKAFLETLRDRLKTLRINKLTIYSSPHAMFLQYSKKNSLKLLKFIYKGLNKAPYLGRKYKIFQNYLKTYN